MADPTVIDVRLQYAAAVQAYAEALHAEFADDTNVEKIRRSWKAEGEMQRLQPAFDATRK